MSEQTSWAPPTHRGGVGDATGATQTWRRSPGLASWPGAGRARGRDRMRPGEASETARRVAAHRLTFDRAPTPHGAPELDDRLANDVAGGVAARSGSGMGEYLRARTTFFDRVVIAALDRGVRQVVVAAAGYDGRALRYGKEGVRWFELDHPDTQADKRARLARLGIDTPSITFVAADFATTPVGPALLAAGVDRAQPSLLLCEGVAVYLAVDVLTALLDGLRDVAGPGSRLAISLSVSSSSPRTRWRRAAFRAAVARLGEPARSELTSEQADALLRRTGWVRPAAASEAAARAQRAGLLVLEAGPRGTG